MNYRLKTPTVQAVQFNRSPEKIKNVRELIKPYILQDDYEGHVKICGFRLDGSVDEKNPLFTLNENEWVMKGAQSYFSNIDLIVLTEDEFETRFESVV